MSHNAQHLLLVSLSNVGDAVLTTPVLAAMHQHWPGALVDIVADERSSELFEFCPWRGRIVHKQKDSFLRGMPGVVRSLWGTRYDAVVDLRTEILPWLLRADRRFARSGARAYGPHAVEQHMGVIAAVHGDAPLPEVSVWTGPAADERGAALRGELPGGRWLSLAPGARWSAKQWPAENFCELIRLLGPDFDAVVLMGNDTDTACAREIAAQSGRRCHDWTGKTGLLEAAAALRGMRVFVGNDSGLGHLAAAAGVPSLTLFGPGEPLRYRPWGRHADWIQAEGGDLRRLAPTTVAARLRAHLDAARPGE